MTLHSSASSRNAAVVLLVLASLCCAAFASVQVNFVVKSSDTQKTKAANQKLTSLVDNADPALKNLGVVSAASGNQKFVPVLNKVNCGTGTCQSESYDSPPSKSILFNTALEGATAPNTDRRTRTLVRFRVGGSKAGSANPALTNKINSAASSLVSKFNLTGAASGPIDNFVQISELPSVSFNPNFSPNHAVFTPPASGNYSFRVGVLDRCGARFQDVTVAAICSRPSPFVREYNVTTDVNTYVTLNGTVLNPNPAAQTQYVWCLLQEGSGINITNVNSPMPKIWVGTNSVQFQAQLSVSDGCATARYVFTINVQCRCLPLPTVSTVHAIIQGVNKSAPLIGTSYFGNHQQQEFTNVTYNWVLSSASLSNPKLSGYSMRQLANQGNKASYIFVTPLSSKTSPSTSSTTSTSQGNPLRSTTTIPRQPLQRPSTSEQETVLNVTTVSKVTTTTKSNTSVVIDDYVWCTVNIFDYDKPNATLQISSYLRCQGLLNVELQVAQRGQACPSVSDKFQLDVACSNPPAAEADCSTRTVQWWNATGNNVILYGSDSYDSGSLGLDYFWNLTSVPSIPAPWSGVYTTPTVSNNTQSNAFFAPNWAGAYTAQLSVANDCYVSVDSVTITRHCMGALYSPQLFLSGVLSGKMTNSATSRVLSKNGAFHNVKVQSTQYQDHYPTPFNLIPTQFQKYIYTVVGTGSQQNEIVGQYGPYSDTQNNITITPIIFKLRCTGSASQSAPCNGNNLLKVPSAGTYNVYAHMSDGCQGVTSSAVPLTLTCPNGPSARLSSSANRGITATSADSVTVIPQRNGGVGASITYPEVTLNASSSIVNASMPILAGWISHPNSTVPAITRQPYGGAGSIPLFKYRPTKAGTTYVTFQITDGCTLSTQTFRVIATCPSTPFAPVSLPGGSSFSNPFINWRGVDRVWSQAIIPQSLTANDNTNAYQAIRGSWLHTNGACSYRLAFSDNVIVYSRYYNGQNGGSCNVGFAVGRFSLTSNQGWNGGLNASITYANITRGDNSFPANGVNAGSASVTSISLVNQNSLSFGGLSFSKVSTSPDSFYGTQTQVATNVGSSRCRVSLTGFGGNFMLTTVDRCPISAGAGAYWAVQDNGNVNYLSTLTGPGGRRISATPQLTGSSTSQPSALFWMVAGAGSNNIGMNGRGSSAQLRGSYSHQSSAKSYMFLGRTLVTVSSNSVEVDFINSMEAVVYPMPMILDSVTTSAFNKSRPAAIGLSCNTVLLRLGTSVAQGTVKPLALPAALKDALSLSITGPQGVSYSAKVTTNPAPFTISNATCPFALLVPTNGNFNVQWTSTASLPVYGCTSTSSSYSLSASCFGPPSNTLPASGPSSVAFSQASNTFVTAEFSANQVNYQGSQDWLRWTWSVTAAPATSKWVPTSSVSSVSSATNVQSSALSPRVTLNDFVLKDNLQPVSLPQLRPSVNIHRLSNQSWSASTTTVVETTTKTVITNVLYSNDLNQTSTACLTPDVPGTYKVTVTSTDGCFTQSREITFSAGCSALQGQVRINGTALNPGQSVVVKMSPKEWSRVQLSSTGVSSPQGPLTVSWAVTKREINGDNVAFSLSNSNGPEASFIPDLSTNYNVTATFTDGCQTVAYTYIVLMNCPEFNPPSITNVVYSKNGGAFPSVTIGRNITSECLPMNPGVVTYQGRVCNTPANIPLSPPPPAAAKNCLVATTYAWKLVQKPCNSVFSIGVVSQLAGGQFTPDVAGNYVLEFIQSNGCTTVRSNVTLTARCKQQLAATVADRTVLTSCDGSGGFDSVTLTADVSRQNSVFVPAVSCPLPVVPSVQPVTEKCMGWTVEIDGPCCSDRTHQTCDCSAYCRLGCAEACPGGYPSGEFLQTTAAPTTGAPTTQAATTTAPGTTAASSTAPSTTGTTASPSTTASQSSADGASPRSVPLSELLPESLSKPRGFSIQDRLKAWGLLKGDHHSGEITYNDDGSVVVQPVPGQIEYRGANGVTTHIYRMENLVSNRIAKSGRSSSFGVRNSTPAPSDKSDYTDQFKKKPTGGFVAAVAVVAVLLLLNIVLTCFIRRRVRQLDGGGQAFDVMAADVELSTHQ